MVDFGESEVRSYCRSFPAEFDRALGSMLIDSSGREYIDFLCGAGALNYGHNNPAMKRAIVDYLNRDGITHSLDLGTVAKHRFMERFRSSILQPRRMNMRFQFTGPTGTNGVEAALKLARKVTGRRNIVAFTGAYHGLSGGSLAVTANCAYRNDRYVNRSDVTFCPFEGYYGDVDTLQFIEKLLADPLSGLDHPAAVIVETVQGEGGVNIASRQWLRRLQQLCKEHNVLLIVDDIQAGIGRTGTFFSFEFAEIVPDIVILSKSLSGYGLPMTMLLLAPEIDVWSPGEHSGTFRGNNLAFIAAAEALSFWEQGEFERDLYRKSMVVRQCLENAAIEFSEKVKVVRGRGLFYGLEMHNPGIASAVRRTSFEKGLIVETCGPCGSVIKLLPPLTIDEPTLSRGLDLLVMAIGECTA